MGNLQENFAGKLKSFFQALYEKLVKINDSPQRIALGLGLGVFFGILPGAGPIASVVLAALLRVNKAAALLGSLLTNTWLSVVTFLLAIKVGSVLTGVNRRIVYDQCKLLLKNFRWKDLFDISMIKILKPLIVGYFVVAFVAAVMAYLITITILNQRKITKQPVNE